MIEFLFFSHIIAEWKYIISNAHWKLIVTMKCIDTDLFPYSSYLILIYRLRLYFAWTFLWQFHANCGSLLDNVDAQTDLVLYTLHKNSDFSILGAKLTFAMPVFVCKQAEYRHTYISVIITRHESLGPTAALVISDTLAYVM